MMLNPTQTKILADCRSRIVNLPNGDLVLSGVSIRFSPNLDILGMKIDCKLTFADHVRGILFLMSLTELVFLIKRLSVHGHLCVTSLLLCICYMFDFLQHDTIFYDIKISVVELKY